MEEPAVTTNIWQPQNPLEADDWTIGVSLSGGGYRATVFAIGALVALHDANAWERIRWIASVSGGSFANAAAAVQLPPTPSSDDLDVFVEQVVSTVTRRGSLLWWRRDDRSSSDRGPTSKAYAAGIQRNWTRRADGSQPRLVDLVRDDRVHAFMAADIASSRPVALTDRLVFSEGMAEEFQVAYRPGNLSLATAVRASASFAGLPAVRLSKEDLGAPLQPAEDDLLLVDGGTWNNLGTDWSRFVRWFDRTYVLPAAIPRDVSLHIVVNASAPPTRPSRRRTLRPLSYDTLGMPFLRAFRVAINSTVAGYRRELRNIAGPTGPVAVVDLDDWPQNIDDRAALDTGRSADDWLMTAGRNRQVGTFVPTMRGLGHASVLDLLAHAHAQVHAHLTRRGLPYGLIARSYERFAEVRTF